MIYSGNDDALLYIIESYSKLLWAIVGNVLNNIGTNEDIEECISDAFMNLWHNPKAYNPKKGTLKTFLAVIAKRRALDKYRQICKLNTVELDETINSQDEDLFEFVSKQDLYSKLYEAIRLLQEPDREILTRRYFFEEMPLDISAKTQIPIKEVKNRLYQSKLRLRKLLTIGGVEYEI